MSRAGNLRQDPTKQERESIVKYVHGTDYCLTWGYGPQTRRVLIDAHPEVYGQVLNGLRVSKCPMGHVNTPFGFEKPNIAFVAPEHIKFSDPAKTFPCVFVIDRMGIPAWTYLQACYGSDLCGINGKYHDCYKCGCTTMTEEFIDELMEAYHLGNYDLPEGLEFDDELLLG